MSESTQCARRDRHDRRHTRAADLVTRTTFSSFLAVPFVYSTRHSLLNPNFCPGSALQVCFGSGNTNTHQLCQFDLQLRANHCGAQGQRSDLPGCLHVCQTMDNASAFGDLVNFANPRLSRGLSSTDITHNFVASYVWAIPFDRAFANVPKRLTQGWQMQGITRLATGFPIQMNQSEGDASLVGSSSTDMPNLVGKVVTVNPRDANPGCPTIDNKGCYFLPSAFAENTILGTFGTSNRRFFHGPGFNNTDFGFSKRTVLHENYAFDVRIEFFNIFNHAQFKNPGGDISGDSFGIVTNARDPRIGQLSAKFYW